MIRQHRYIHNNSIKQEKNILKPVENKTNIRIYLKREEIEVSELHMLKRNSSKEKTCNGNTDCN